jgi:hypothetical protein
MGICAGAGYTCNESINDHSIKAVGAVSMMNIGSMFRSGWSNNEKDADAPALEVPTSLWGFMERGHCFGLRLVRRFIGSARR